MNKVKSYPKNWRKVKLGDVVYIKNGDFLPARERKESSSIPVYGSSGILGYTNRSTYEQPVIVVGRVGAYGSVYLTKNESWVTDNALVVQNNQESDLKFIYYLLKILPYDSLVIGSSQPLITQSALCNYPIIVPMLSEQKRIASILSAFDDKIGLNNKINETLEKMAQVIFKEWFVDFRFPDHEKVKFINSEFGKIPKGWKIKPLGGVLDTLESGSRPKGGVYKYRDGKPSIGAENILGLGRYDFSKTKYVPKEFFESMNRGVVKDRDVLLYKDGAQVGRKSMFMMGFPFKECCINEHVFILRSNNEISQEYLYLWLDQFWVIETIKNLGVTSAQPGINQSKVKKGIRILVPPKKIIKEFNASITPIFEKIFQNALENIKLASLRDLLLPKLMSGEIKTKT